MLQDPSVTGKGDSQRRRLLRDPAIRKLLVSDLVSRLGSQMATLALPWFVLTTTGSATRMGLVYAVALLPVAVLGIPSGRVVRRIGSRATVIICDIAQAVLIALIPLLHLADALSFAILLPIVAATGVFQAPYFAAQRLMLPEVLGDDQAAVTASNALIESTTSGARAIGPGVAGFLIGSLGALNVLWIDAATFVFSAAVLFGLPRPERTPAPAAGDTRVSAGLRHVFTDRVLRRLTTTALGYGLLIPLIFMSLPLLADIRYEHNPHVAGWLLAAFGGGAVVGTFSVVRLASRISPLLLGALGGIGIAIPMWFLPMPQPVVTVTLIMIISGTFVPMLNAPVFSITTTRPPPHLRAQVMTVVTTATQLIGPAAYAIAGPLFTEFGLADVQLAAAAGLTLCALVLLNLARTAARDRSPLEYP